MKKYLIFLMILATTGCDGLRRLEGTTENTPDAPVIVNSFQETTTSMNVTANNFVFGYSKVCPHTVDHVRVVADGVILTEANYNLRADVKGLWFYDVGKFETVTITFYYK